MADLRQPLIREDFGLAGIVATNALRLWRAVVFPECFGGRRRQQVVGVDVPVAAGDTVAAIGQGMNVEEAHAGRQRPRLQDRIEGSDQLAELRDLVLR